MDLSGTSYWLWRREFADVQFQLASQDPMQDSPSDHAMSDKNGHLFSILQGESDRVTGVYEGGIKTWEGALDLTTYLAQVLTQDPTWCNGKRIMEVGCF